MRTAHWIAAAVTSLLVFQGCTPDTNEGSASTLSANQPDILGTKWYVYECVYLPAGQHQVPQRNCIPNQTRRESYFLVEEENGGAQAQLTIKLADRATACVFNPTILKKEQSGPWVTGIHVEFKDDCDGDGRGVDKILQLYIARTRSKGDVHGKSCIERLREKARGRDVFADRTEACQPLSPGERHRNVVYWRIGPVDSGKIATINPPGDGQGSGSDEIPP